MLLFRSHVLLCPFYPVEHCVSCLFMFYWILLSQILFFLLFKMSMNPKTIVIFHQQSLQHVLNIVKQSSLCIYRCVKHILFIMLNIVFCREAATVTVLTGLTVWERFAPWPTVALTSCRCSILRRTVLLGKMIGIPYKNFQGIWMIGFRSNFVSVTVNGVEQC